MAVGADKRNEAAQVTVKYADGREFTIPARDIKKRTDQTRGIFADVAAGRARLFCCGHELHLKDPGPHAYGYSDEHSCGWFGLGPHSPNAGVSDSGRQPAAQPTDNKADHGAGQRVPEEPSTPPTSQDLPKEDADREALKVDLCLLTPMPSPFEPGLGQSDGTRAQVRVRTLAAFLNELLYRTGHDRFEPIQAANGTPLDDILQILPKLSINGKPADKVVFVAAPTQRPEAFASFCVTLGTGLGTHVEHPVAIVVGEVSEMTGGDPGWISLGSGSPLLQASREVLQEAKRRYERAYLRINDKRDARVTVAASVVVVGATDARAIGLGLLLLSDAYMMQESHYEVQLSNELVRLGIAHRKPRNAGGATEVPDMEVAGDVVVEVVGIRSLGYIEALERKLERYAALGKRVVMWLVAFGERLSEAVKKIFDAIRRR